MVEAIPDLAALRALVGAAAVERHDHVIVLCGQVPCEVCDSLPAAQAALDRLEGGSAALHADETGHLHRCLYLRSTEPPRWACAAGCAVQRAERAEARLAQLEKALVKYGTHGPRCPIWVTQSRGTCTCGLDAAMEGRDE